MNFYDNESLEFLFAQVMRLHHHRTQKLLGELGIYPGQPPILFMLWKKDGRSQKEFAEMLGLKPATITVMLKRMEKAGWVERKPDPEDLRVSRVFLTERAEKFRPKVKQVLNTIYEESFEGFTQEEKVLMKRFLICMRNNLNRM
ncbi:MAG: MarR family transcriptional regulator [Firmicutes bacterium HGW-Firmicutes-14]|nr:MAG: MarR family transcriptional regulator [Firmicutes bacterium HGW-Firmicutes-14]